MMMKKNLFDLSGKVAVITGASRGIGESIARVLAAYGSYVIVTSRKQEACERVAESIRSEGHKAEARACHIGEVKQLEELFAAVEDDHGRLDILVNNAAANPYAGPVADTPLDAFQKTVDVNIRGYFYATAFGSKLMAKSRSGSIINVASINGVIPDPNLGIYSVTKAAVISMTKAFAKECAANGVRVNALLPGLTDTKFVAPALASNETLLKDMLAHTSLGRIAHPDEMAGAALYLASGAASYTTGACLNVDGGYLIG